MGVRALIVDEFDGEQQWFDIALDWFAAVRYEFEEWEEGEYPVHHGDPERIHFHPLVRVHSHPPDPEYAFLHEQMDPLELGMIAMFGVGFESGGTGKPWGKGMEHLYGDVPWSELLDPLVQKEVEAVWRASRGIPAGKILSEAQQYEVFVKYLERYPDASLARELEGELRAIRDSEGMAKHHLAAAILALSVYAGWKWAEAVQAERYLPVPGSRPPGELDIGYGKMLTERPTLVFEGGGELDPMVGELLLEAFLMGIGTESGGFAELGEFGEDAVIQLSPRAGGAIGLLIQSWIAKTGSSPFFLYGFVTHASGYGEVRGTRVYMLRYSWQFNTVIAELVPAFVVE